MKSLDFLGLEVNEITMKKIFLDTPMLIAYVFLIIAAFGIYEIYDLRYFSATANAYSSGLNPTNPELVEAMKLAVFGTVGEVNREIPWTLFIVNYMYMIYTGSGIIFLVALSELLGIKLVARASAGFMVIGLSMVLAGLFTIATDLNMINMIWMLKDPNVNTGMWLMLPLYCIYVPYTIFEIYLLLTNKRELARKLALPLLFLSIGIDVVEYYIQARLFSMNTARQLWTEFPILTFYFIITSFVTGLGIMGVNIYLVHKDKPEYKSMMELVRKGILIFVSILGVYEVVAYLVVDKDWAFLILFGPFRYLYFLGYILFTLALPFLLVVIRRKPIYTVLASVFTVIGGFFGRYLFVYGGNANPMSNRFGTGYEKYDMYDVANTFNYVHPHLGEICIAIGSIGVCIVVYHLFDVFFSLDKLRDAH